MSLKQATVVWSEELNENEFWCVCVCDTDGEGLDVPLHHVLLGDPLGAARGGLELGRVGVAGHRHQDGHVVGSGAALELTAGLRRATASTIRPQRERRLKKKKNRASRRFIDVARLLVILRGAANRWRAQRWPTRVAACQKYQTSFFFFLFSPPPRVLGVHAGGCVCLSPTFTLISTRLWENFSITLSIQMRGFTCHTEGGSGQDQKAEPDSGAVTAERRSGFVCSGGRQNKNLFGRLRVEPQPNTSVLEDWRVSFAEINVTWSVCLCVVCCVVEALSFVCF